VKLTLKKTDGSVKMVSLIRDEIVLEETFAKSAIIDDGNKKIGYIYLPEFYADWERPNGARCSVDVAKEIMKLKEQNVNGIIMDLRGNGGGSLVDVIQMVGLFIEEGPVVQVKDREGNPSVLRDRDKSVLYGGPLAVIVNELSASASEIFAAAIQDYKRGVIIGSSTTYGKGTVQRNIGLDPSSGLLANANDLGTLKLTLQKFYRINGGSTQLKGVAPDIVLPDQLEYMKFREKDDPDALKWDEIQKANYSTWNSDINLPTIEKASADRVANNQAFKLIKENTAWLSRVSDKEYPLNLKKYKEEQVAIRATVKQMENLTKLSNTLSVKAIPQDINKYANDKDKQDRLNQWYKNLSGDIYLGEAVNVMADMITQTSLAKKDN
jgi:carboxyl-terminal processing protease